MTTPSETRNPPIEVTIFWLLLAAAACLGTRWLAGIAGADWRLATMLALGAGLGMLVIGGLCCVAAGDS